MLEDSWHVHRIGSIPSSLDMRCVGDSEVRFLSCQFLSNVFGLGEVAEHKTSLELQIFKFR